MDFADLRQHWNQFGETDPLWAVLTDDDKRFGRWDVEEFFASGRAEIARVFEATDEILGAAGRSRQRGRALDFGCAVGRATQALCEHYDRCDGVDIAASMIRQAEEYNKFPGRCSYQLSTGQLLEQFEDGAFDLIYSAHVLQHMETRYQRAYLAEFVRLLAPAGVAVLEMVTDRVVGACEALPEDAFRYDISLLVVPARLAPAERALVRVQVTNTSAHTWPAAGTEGWFQVTAGNHWRSAQASETSAAPAVLDDGRVHLAADLGPGQTVALALAVAAPSSAGTYRLVLDMVQEGVGWFESAGCRPAVAEVIVGGPAPAPAQGARRGLRRLRGPGSAPAPDSAPAAAGPDEPAPQELVMEMHGQSEDEVRRAVEAGGGQVLAVLDWDRVFDGHSLDWHRRAYVIVHGD